MSTPTDLAEISRRHMLGEITGPTATRLTFELRERTALRVTLITYEDGSRSARYGRVAVTDPGVRTVEYPECTKEEWRELHDQTTTLERVRKILDNLTTL